MRNRINEFMEKHSVVVTGAIITSTIYGASGRFATGLIGYICGAIIVVAIGRVIGGK